MAQSAIVTELLEFYSEITVYCSDVSFMDLANNYREAMTTFRACGPLDDIELKSRVRSIVKAYYLSGKDREEKIDFSNFLNSKMQEILNVEYMFEDSSNLHKVRH